MTHIQAPLPQHPTIPVDELRPKYAILQSKRESCELQHWCISIMTMAVFFSSCALVLCGFMIVKPALATQGFKEALCTVEETVSLGKRDCKCGGFSNDDPYCESRFLCIQIRVKYHDPQEATDLAGVNPWNAHMPEDYGNDTLMNDVVDEPTHFNGILYENELQVQSKNQDCSFSVCKPAEQANLVAVNYFNQRKGEVNERYTCYYNPLNNTQVIGERHYKKVHIFHALFWPSAIFVISIVSYCLVRRCHREEKLARRRYNEMNGISNVNRGNFISDMKDRNYMQPIRTENGWIPTGLPANYNSTNTMTRLTSYNGPCSRG